MYINEYTKDSMYSIAEAANILNKSVEQVEFLIRSNRIGFTVNDFGPVISGRQLSGYVLHEKPPVDKPYRPEVKRPRPRKRYPKARSKR